MSLETDKYLPGENNTAETEGFTNDLLNEGFTPIDCYIEQMYRSLSYQFPESPKCKGTTKDRK
jgi:hypothetical protein